MPQYICIGVPYFLGQRLDNRAEVAAVENSGFAAEIGAPWINITPDFAASADAVTAVNRTLAQTIAAHPDHIPLIFVSDCTSALGAMKGLEAQQPAVLWYDAHGDFNTPETTPSGFLGGLPLAMLVGRGDMQYMQGIGLAPIAEQDVILTDARELDPEEAVMLQESRVTHLTSVNDLLSTPLPNKPLYIHFDTDVVDISEMPGMSYPAPGGPSVNTCAATLQHVARNAHVAGLLFTLWNDSLPTDGQSLTATLHLARSFVGANA